MCVGQIESDANGPRFDFPRWRYAPLSNNGDDTTDDSLLYFFPYSWTNVLHRFHVRFNVLTAPGFQHMRGAAEKPAFGPRRQIAGLPRAPLRRA
jgi:hypothetical protein